MDLCGILDEHDPLALRLALLRWRYQVADWADMPPAPMVGDSVETTGEALVSDKDICTVLKLMHRVEADLHLASGSKFTTFSYLDRALGLDVGYLIGTVRR